MIKVKNLTKKFGHFKAVDNISFEIKKGEIVGFLGPNGAGKTTTMRIITGYLTGNAGEISIDNFDILANSLEARKKIGYLPENTPFYGELNVLEYLEYLAEMHDIPAENRGKRIRYVIESCGLKEKIKNEMTELSKGYRQRVGLAQALIHNPDVLILDEPTSGLDPNQIVEIRNLIKKISKEKTIILCTHILSEVEATCDRVIIINKGKIVSEGTPRELKQAAPQKTKIIVDINGNVKKEILNSIKTIEGVIDVKKLETEEEGTTKLEIETTEGLDLRGQITRNLIDHGLDLLGMKKELASFEDVFAQLTKE